MATYALMQSRVELSGHLTPHLLPAKPMARHSKPKLSLDTAPQRSFGRASTGLRLETLSPSSPTRSNTYKNSYDPQILPRGHASSTFTSTPNPLPSQLPEDQDALSQISEDSFDESTQMPQSTPYSLPPDTQSILTNGPLTKRSRSRQASSTPPSSTPSSASSDRSSLKRVCFRDPVSEDIRTTQYLLAHSDIRSRSVSPCPNATDASKHQKIASTGHLPPKAREVAPTAHQQAVAKDGEDDNGSAIDADKTALPKTPVTGRNKDREWIWTLGPVAGIKSPGSSLLIDELSDEDLDDSLGETVAAASGFL